MSAQTNIRVKLNDGASIPVVGFGAGTALFGKESVEVIKKALSTGYRYLDAAQMYKNSESIGTALKESGVKREDVFILTKLGKDGASSDEIEPRRVLQEELKKLQTDHVDLFLIHAPMYMGDRGLAGTWAVLEELVKEGLTRSIGVSNFREEDLLELEKTWKIKPVVNQIEFHPYVFHAANMQRLLAFQKKHDIKVHSYGCQTPIFRVPGGPVDAVVERIAKEQGLTSGQVLLLWARQYTGGVVVTTSRDDGRQREQLDAFKHSLTGEQVDAISEAGRGKYFRHFMEVVWDHAKP